MALFVLLFKTVASQDLSVDILFYFISRPPVIAILFV